MSDIVIQVENLSKAYRIGLKEQIPDTLAGAMVAMLKAPFRNFRHLRDLDTSRRNGDAEDIFWALKDVSFEVKEGEVVGIIGRNGAGKSTLPKILSRITEPTSGRAVIHGRVASLLEVGTGFHPEMTGRENIYMNGTILGMRKREIDSKFDEIVAFSGVESFIDTPIKRYSSGMKVRLAFSVAAHLEPEILIIDEVLAVGDQEFQKKCLGKMDDVARSGRTVLFVSHQIDAILSLCAKVLLLESGRCIGNFPAMLGVQHYHSSQSTEPKSLKNLPRLRESTRSPIFSDLIITPRNTVGRILPAGGGVTFTVELQNLQDIYNLECAIVLKNMANQRVVLFHTKYHSSLCFEGKVKQRLKCEVPTLPLVPGTYIIELQLSDGGQTQEAVSEAGTLEVVFSDAFGTGRLPNSRQGNVLIPCKWEVLG